MKISLEHLIAVVALTAATLACSQQEGVHFGAVLPETGVAGVYGNSIRKGIELALEEIQTESERTISLEFVDSGSDPDRAAEAADQLLDGGALALIGGVTTPEALAMIEAIDQHDRVLLSPSASSPALTGASINFFRVFFSDFTEGVKMANFAAVKQEITSVVIIAQSEEYAKGIQDVFLQEFERNGGTVMETIEVPEGTDDLSGVVQRVRTLSPEAVFIAGYANDIAKAVVALRDIGFSGRILTTHAFASGEVLAQAGSAADKVLLTLPVFDPHSEEEPVKSFVEAFEAAYEETPDVWAAHGYDAMKILYEALPEQMRTAADFWRGMRQIDDYPGVTGPIRFDEKGDVSRFPRVFMVDGGELVDYEAEVDRKRRELEERLQELRERRRRARG